MLCNISLILNNMTKTCQHFQTVFCVCIYKWCIFIEIIKNLLELVDNFHHQIFMCYGYLMYSHQPKMTNEPKHKLDIIIYQGVREGAI